MARSKTPTRKKSSTKPKAQPRQPRRWPWVLLVLALTACVAGAFVTVDTADTTTGAVEDGDLVLMESATAATLDPKHGQIIAVAQHGMSEVIAVGGDRVEYRRGLRINGASRPLSAPLKQPEATPSRVSPLLRGASVGVGRKKTHIPASLDIPRSPFEIPRHHVLVARTRGGQSTTHLVPYADIVATGRVVLASRTDGERSLPRLLP